MNLDNLKRIESIQEVEPGDRLFYELNYVRDVRETGVVEYREIKSVQDFIKRDPRLQDPKFIAFHGFHVLKAGELPNPLPDKGKQIEL